MKWQISLALSAFKKTPFKPNNQLVNCLTLTKENHLYFIFASHILITLSLALHKQKLLEEKDKNGVVTLVQSQVNMQTVISSKSFHVKCVEQGAYVHVNTRIDTRTNWSFNFHWYFPPKLKYSFYSRTCSSLSIHE